MSDDYDTKLMRALRQIIQEATTLDELKGIGQRLKNEPLRDQERNMLRAVYAEMLVKLHAPVSSNDE